MSTLIVADGEKLSTNRLRPLSKNKKVIACDNGAESCLRQNLVPDIVIGDLDSLAKSTRDKLSKLGCEIIQIDDQNTTDSEKALIWAADNGLRDVVLAQAIGERTDHSLYNLRLLKKYHHQFESLSLAREIENIYFFEYCRISLAGKSGLAVALMGFDQAVISTKGLKYDSTDLTIGANHRESISNELTANKAEIVIEGCVLGIFSYEIEILAF